MAPKKKSAYFQPLSNTTIALGKLENLKEAQIFPLPTSTSTSTPDLFSRLRKPSPGDWLDEHEESGQTFPSFVKLVKSKSARTRPPSKTCDTILLVPIGSSSKSALSSQFIAHLLKSCQAFFHPLKVAIFEETMNLKTVERRENEFGQKQYLLSDLYTLINTKTSRLHNVYTRLGVTFEDIYPSDDFNFVYGQALPFEKVGVFSFSRHSPAFGKSDPPPLTKAQTLSWLEGAVRTMCHENLHLLGLTHCIYFKCLINGNNGPGDSAGHCENLCPCCLRKFMFSLSHVDANANVFELGSVVKYYQRLLEAKKTLCRTFSLSEEKTTEKEAWLVARIAQLGGGICSVCVDT